MRSSLLTIVFFFFFSRLSSSTVSCYRGLTYCPITLLTFRRTVRGRGAVGSRMDDTGPFLPKPNASSASSWPTPYYTVDDREEKYQPPRLGPEKPKEKIKEGETGRKKKVGSKESKRDGQFKAEKARKHWKADGTGMTTTSSNSCDDSNSSSSESDNDSSERGKEKERLVDVDKKKRRRESTGKSRRSSSEKARKRRRKEGEEEARERRKRRSGKKKKRKKDSKERKK